MSSKTNLELLAVLRKANLNLQTESPVDKMADDHKPYFTGPSPILHNGTFDLSSVWRILKDAAEACEASKNASLAKLGGCDERPLYRVLNGYAFAPMLLLCLFGNCVTIAIYRQPTASKLVAVRMLAVKAVLNTLFVLSLIPTVPRLMQLWDVSSPLELTYWRVWPFFHSSANIFGACATWVVVLMTLERYLYVVYPVKSRRLCTNKNFWKMLLLIFTVAIMLNAPLPFSRKVDKVKEIDCVSSFKLEVSSRNPQIESEATYHYRLIVKSDSFNRAYINIVYYAQLVLVIVVPLLLMSLMSVVILHRLMFNTKPGISNRHIESSVDEPMERQQLNVANGNASVTHRGTNRRLTHGLKRCVTRITISTTLAHLVLELPSGFIHTLAALFGVQTIRTPTMCVCHAIANFLGLCNASIIFFIYLLFSPTYRNLCMTLFGCVTPATRHPSTMALAPPASGTTYSAMSGQRNQRSYRELEAAADCRDRMGNNGPRVRQSVRPHNIEFTVTQHRHHSCQSRMV